MPNNKKAKKEAQVIEWNDLVRPGDPVIYRDDFGEDHLTITTSEAYLLSGHTPVVMLRDVSGCYLLERVRTGKAEGKA